MNFDHTSTGDQFAELLVGRKIVKAQNNALWLDSGLKLKITTNEGGCSCGAGSFHSRAEAERDEARAELDKVIREAAADKAELATVTADLTAVWELLDGGVRHDCLSPNHNDPCHRRAANVLREAVRTALTAAPEDSYPPDATPLPVALETAANVWEDDGHDRQGTSPALWMRDRAAALRSTEKGSTDV